MCLAIVRKAGAVITDAQLRKGWDNNRDGAGFAYSDSGKVVITKGLMSWEQFIKQYRESEEANPTSNFLIHFRIRTSGYTNQDNTHPFNVGCGALIHNGSFFTPKASIADCSDTNITAEKVASLLKTKEEWLLAKDSVEKVLDYNKVAVLFDDGEYTIFNENKGCWYKDIWFSNTWAMHT